MKTFNYLKIFLLLFGLTSCLIGYGQTKTDRLGMDEKEAKKALKSALTDTTQHNVINRKTLILKDEKTAIEFAEKILFDIYGAEEIKNQRPYRAYNIDNYWVISGTLADGWVGGTFLIIIDAYDCRILRLTHGK